MRTATRLGVSRNTVRARMDRWGLRTGREGAIGPPAPAGGGTTGLEAVTRSRDPRPPRSTPCGGSDGT